MQERHTDRKRYFTEQGITVEKYVIPLLSNYINIDKNTSVLEIGCGEGGNLSPFMNLGCNKIVGIDLSEGKIKNAKSFFKDHPNAKNIEFIHNDIYNMEALGEFDIILTRDVLEHIHGQERFMQFVKKFLKPGGLFFLGFPPWYNPFGGHQQICENKMLSKLPYFHILPSPLYRFILKSFGESKAKIENLMEVKETGITIERFEKIIRKTGYKKVKRIFYFINPNYEVKFGLKPRKQNILFSSIPYFRNFIITTNYYLVTPE